MDKIISDIICGSGVASVHDLLKKYHFANLKTMPYELCCFKYKQLIESLNQEFDYLSSIDVNWAMQDYGEVNVHIAKSNIEYAKEFLSNPPKQSVRKPIIIDEMPDFLTDEDLHQYFGWETSTIASKRSRGELPKVNGQQLTPKTELIKLLDTNTICAPILTAKIEKEKATQEKVASYKRKK